MVKVQPHVPNQVLVPNSPSMFQIKTLCIKSKPYVFLNVYVIINLNNIKELKDHLDLICILENEKYKDKRTQ